MLLTFVPDHIPHSLLSIYALGGSPEDIRAAYERNQLYQRKAVPVNVEVVEKLNETGDFKEYLGKGKHYSNFLSFFQRQIDEKGVDAVLNEYVFAGNAQAENMLCRVWGGASYHGPFRDRHGVLIQQYRSNSSTHPSWVRARVQSACHRGPGPCAGCGSR